MAEGNFVQPAIPRFDGYYDHWAMLMENLLRSKDYWSLIESGIPASTTEAEHTEVQQKHMEEMRLKDLKVKIIFFNPLIALSWKQSWIETLQKEYGIQCVRNIKGPLR
jgi:hypothetical protein